MTDNLDDDFQGFVQRREARRLRAMGEVAPSLAPEQVGEAQRIARQRGVPAIAVMDDLESIRADEQARALQARSPAVAAFVGETPERFALTRDDHDGLVALEGAVSDAVDVPWWMDVYRWARGRDAPLSERVSALFDPPRAAIAGAVRAAGAGVAGLGEAADTVERGIVRASGASENLEFARQVLPFLEQTPGAVAGRGLRAAGEPTVAAGEAMEVPEDRRGFDTEVAGAVGQIGFSALQAALLPQTVVPHLVGQGAHQGAEEARQAGAYGTARGDQATLAYGAVTGVSEKVGLDLLLERVPPKIRNRTVRWFADKFLAGAIEGTQEVVEGVGQNLTAQQTIDPERETLEGAGEAFSVAGVAGALVRMMVPGRARGDEPQSDDIPADPLAGAPPETVGAAAEALAGLAPSVTDAAKLAELQAAARATKTGDRDPEAVQAFVQAQLDRTPGLPSTVYLNAQSVMEYFQSIGEDGAARVAEMVGDPLALAEAQAGTGDLAMPLGAFVAGPLRGEHGDALRDIARLAPDRVSNAELQAMDLDALVERFGPEPAGTVDPAAVQAEDAETYVRDAIRAQIDLTGRYDQGASDRIATTLARQYAVRAQRRGRGETARDLLEQYPVRIVDAEPGAGAPVDVALDPYIDDVLRHGTEPRSRTDGKTLVQAVIESGGIRPDSPGADDLRSMAGGRAPPGFFNAGGLTVEAMGESLGQQDSGWAHFFPDRDEYDRVTLDSFREILGESLRGEGPRLVESDSRSAFLGLRDEVADAMRALERRGVDIRSMGRPALRQMVEEELGRDPGTFYQDALPEQSEIEQLRARVAELERELRTDPLTGLRNWRAFTEDEALGWPAVASFDLDGLKRVNDMFGHDAGDAMLRQAAGVFLAAERDGVRLYRKGGDEFAMRAADPVAAQALAQEIIDRLESVDVVFTHGGDRYVYNGIGAGYGIAETFEEADQRLNADKQRREAAGLREARGADGAPRRARRISDRAPGVDGDRRGAQPADAAQAQGRLTVEEARAAYQRAFAKFGGEVEFDEIADLVEQGSPEAGPAALVAFAAGDFTQLTTDTGPVGQALAEYVRGMEPSPQPKLYRVLAFPTAEARAAVVERMRGVGSDGLVETRRPIMSFTSENPEGQTPMSNIGRDVASQFGEFELVVELTGPGGSPVTQGRNISFVYDGAMGEGSDVEIVMPAGVRYRFVGESTRPTRGGEEVVVRLETTEDAGETTFFQSQAAPFYSALLRSVEQAKGAPKRGNATQWKQWLDGAQRRGEFRQAERDWLGIDAWLDAQEGPVTRDALAEFVRANQVQVEEVTLGGRDGEDFDPDAVDLSVTDEGYDDEQGIATFEIEDEATGYSFTVTDMEGDSPSMTIQAAAGPFSRAGEVIYSGPRLTDYTGTIRDWIVDKHMKADGFDGPTKYTSYQLPGGENYRELLLTLPQEKVEADPVDTTGWTVETVSDEAYYRYTGQREIRVRDARGDVKISRAGFRGTDEEAIAEAAQAFQRADVAAQRDSKDFRSGHWEQPNVLAHVRYNERVDADGKRVLFIEEIQSDWHQAGRKRGYSSPAVSAVKVGDEITILGDGLRDRYEQRWEITREDGRTEEIGLPVGVDPMRGAADMKADGVPDAPFKGTDEWAMLAFKRMVRYAVDNGFERIAWTTGEQQAARYDLSQQVSTIDVSESGNGRYVTIHPTGGAPISLFVGDDGIVGSGPAEFSGKPLDSVVGKEIADRIIGAKGNKRLEGVDLALGGDGMRAFYDKILPAAVNKWGKRFGAKVGRTRLANETATSERNDDLALLAALDQDVGTATPTEGAEVVHALDLTDTMREAAMAGQALFQRKRGSITLGAQEVTIRLGDDADLSTLHHEFGHLFLNGLMEDAFLEGANPQLAQDLDAFLQATGSTVRVADGREAVGAAIGREQHEKFAEWYETYLFEGRAPSPALTSLFARFRAWMLSVYGALRARRVPLPEAMRGVYDRLLATDAEIEAATGQAGFDTPLPDGVKALVSEERWARYQRELEAAVDHRRASLQAGILQAERREREAWWKEELDALRTVVADEAMQDRGQRALSLLSRGTLPDGSPVEWRDGAPELRQLSHQALVDEFGEGFVARLKGKRVTTKKDGMSPAVAADLLGFRNAGELVEALANARPFRQHVEAEAQERMRAKHPDPLAQDSLPQAALDAVHSSPSLRPLQVELDLIAELAGQPVPEPRVMGAMARRIINAKRLRDVRPNDYLVAERKAAREAQQALAKARPQLAVALEAKRRQAMNAHLYRAALEAQETLRKETDYLKRFLKPAKRKRLAKVGRGHLETIDGLLEQIDLKQASGATIDRRLALLDYVRKATERGETITVPPAVLELAQRTNVRDLSVDALRGIADTVRQADHLARRWEKVHLAQEKRTYEEIDEEIAAAVRAGAKGGRLNRTGDKTRGERLLSHLAPMDVLRLLPSNVARDLDGYEEGGPVFAQTIQVVRDAFYRKFRPAWEDYQERLASLYSEHYSRAELGRLDRPVYREAVGDSWSKARILTLALNWGNVDNRDRILNSARGRLSMEQVGQLLQTLDSRDWDFVEGAWGLIDSLWPQIRETHRRRSGVIPEKVEAAPFVVTLPDGTQRQIKGGYYPIRYDADRTGVKVTKDEATEFFEAMTTSRFSKAQTKHGHVEARVGGGGRTVDLSLDLMSRHLHDVLRDLHLGDAVNHVHRVLQGPEFIAAVNASGKTELHGALDVWLRDVATGELPASRGWEKLLQLGRRNLSMAVLTFKVSTGLLQLTGLVQTTQVIGARNTAWGFWRFKELGPLRVWDYVDSASPFMRQRNGTQIEAVQRVANARAGRLRSAYAAAERVGWFMIAKLQRVADVVTWLGAERKGLLEGMTVAQARAYADDVVIRAQAASEFIDKPSIIRGNLGQNTRQSELVKSLVPFMSYMIAKGNVAREKYQRTRFRSPMQSLRFGLDMVMLFAVEAMLLDALRNGLPDDDDEDGWVLDDWMWYVAGTISGDFAATIPIVSLIATEGRGYTAQAPYERVADIVARANMRVFGMLEDKDGDGDPDGIDRAAAKAIIELLGVTVGAPSSQMNTTLDAVWDRAEGEDVAPIDYLIRREKPKE